MYSFNQVGLDTLLMGLVDVSPVSIVGLYRVTLSSRFWMDEPGEGDVVSNAVG